MGLQIVSEKCLLQTEIYLKKARFEVKKIKLIKKITVKVEKKILLINVENTRLPPPGIELATF